MPAADILQALNEDDARDVRALAVSAVLSIEGRQDLQCGLFVLLQRGRELSDERLHEKCVVARHNVHLHPKRLELCRNNWADSRNGDAFEALQQFRFSAGRAGNVAKALSR